MHSTTNLLKVIEEHKEMKRIKDYTEVIKRVRGEMKTGSQANKEGGI